MTRVDWIALGVVGISALAGLRRGLVAGLFSVGGFVAGAVIGGRVARHFLSGGSSSPYLPLVALAGALVFAAVLQMLAGLVGSILVKAQYYILDNASAYLFDLITDLTEVFVVSALERQIDGRQVDGRV